MRPISGSSGWRGGLPCSPGTVRSPENVLSDARSRAPSCSPPRPPQPTSVCLAGAGAQPAGPRAPHRAHACITARAAHARAHAQPARTQTCGAGADVPRGCGSGNQPYPGSRGCTGSRGDWGASSRLGGGEDCLECGLPGELQNRASPASREGGGSRRAPQDVGSLFPAAPAQPESAPQKPRCAHFLRGDGGAGGKG